MGATGQPQVNPQCWSSALVASWGNFTAYLLKVTRSLLHALNRPVNCCMRHEAHQSKIAVGSPVLHLICVAVSEADRGAKAAAGRVNTSVSREGSKGQSWHDHLDV